VYKGKEAVKKVLHTLAKQKKKEPVEKAHIEQECTAKEKAEEEKHGS